jgi:hypothetical protein
MVKCPDCDKEIDYLIKEVVDVKAFAYTPDESEELDFREDMYVVTFRCPKCHVCLFTDEYEAVEFLEPHDYDKEEIDNTWHFPDNVWHINKFKCNHAYYENNICNLGYACDGCPYNYENLGIDIIKI